MVRTKFRTLLKMHLIFDFDGTITTKDTIGSLASAGIAAQKLSRGANLQPAWDALVQTYLADYDAYRAQFTPKEAERTAIAQEKLFLGGFKDVEEASLRRVGEAALFKDLGPAAMRRLGEEAVQNGNVKLRPGFGNIVQAARERGWPVGVVSVNWSADFIRGAVGDMLREDDAVIANSTREADGTICGPAALDDELLVCAPDKLRAMLQLLQASKVVYFGDSTTDLECLVEAHRGVVMVDDEGGESSLLRTLTRLGFEVPHVEENKTIAWARTFDEVIESGLLSD